MNEDVPPERDPRPLPRTMASGCNPIILLVLIILVGVLAFAWITRGGPAPNPTQASPPVAPPGAGGG